MKTRFLLSILACAFLTLDASAQAASDTRCYEMRTYFAAPDKLDALLARFRDHTCKLFEKHGIANVGYWVPIDNSENKLVYMVSYPSREDREKSWKAFLADPDWKAAKEESERNGKLVLKVESRFMQATDYSPMVKPSNSKDGRVFELRTYTATEGNLGNLNARFRDHTVKLFDKHGMTNIGYWNLMKDQEGSDVTLVYMLSHNSREAAKESFGAFGKDPEWQSARKESEAKGGGSLTIKGGVKSVFMTATDFSPIK